MQVHRNTPLLGGLSPAQFMARHWQKKPLLVRGALTPAQLARLPGPDALFSLAQRDDLNSRLITQRGGAWQVRHGPFAALPSPRRKHWTVLVQDVNLHLPAVARLLRRFRFVPDARLDDVMFSYASDGGGVGPHADSYDVFLLQVQGRRHWAIAPLRLAKSRALVPGAPLKLLANFSPTQQFVLEPGDMLYLPPGWGHEGVAQGAGCITASVGFRAPTQGELLAALLERLAEAVRDDPRYAALYQDAHQSAARNPAALPAVLQAFLAQGQAKLSVSAAQRELYLGEYLSEPKPQVWFEPPAPRGWPSACARGVRVADRSRLLLGRQQLYLNGEAYELPPAEAAWWRRFAQRGAVDAAQLKAAPAAVQAQLQQWWRAGWLQTIDAEEDES